MTCGGIVILAERAQAAGSKHFNQAQLDATWENITVLLRLIERENARAQCYLNQLIQLKEQARSAYFCKRDFALALVASKSTHSLCTTARNSEDVIRMTSCRPSISPEDSHNRNSNSTFSPSMDDQAMQGELFTLLFQDDWGWNVDGNMPTYGGFTFGNEFAFLPPS